MMSNKKGQAKKKWFPVHNSKAEFTENLHPGKNFPKVFSDLKMCLCEEERPNRIEKATLLKKKIKNTRVCVDRAFSFPLDHLRPFS